MFYLTDTIQTSTCTWKQVTSAITNIRNESKVFSRKMGAQYFNQPRDPISTAAHESTVPSSDKVGVSRVCPLLQITIIFSITNPHFYTEKETNISNNLAFILLFCPITLRFPPLFLN